MVASSGSAPIGVLIGAKRPSGTLIHKIAVHPDHRRQGHGRHMLASLGSKLAILGPPRMIAEVPETLTPACELFSASGYVQEAVLTDYVLQREEDETRDVAGTADDHDGRFVIPVTVDDLAANGLFGEAHSQVWKRSVETVNARKEDIAGLAVVSDERIEAYLLYVKPGVGLEGNVEVEPGASHLPAEIVSFRTFVEDGGARMKQLLTRLRAQGITTLRFPTVHPAEISQELLETLGFQPAGGHLLYAMKARSD